MPKDTVSLVASNFSNNVVYGDAADEGSPLVVQGGGLYLQDAVASASAATFLQNTAWVEGANQGLSEAGGGGVALLTQTPSSASVLTLAQASFLLNTVGGVSRNFGGALYKDLLSVLDDERGMEVVPMEMALAGTEDEVHKSLNDVVLVTPVRALIMSISGACLYVCLVDLLSLHTQTNGSR